MAEGRGTHVSEGVRASRTSAVILTSIAEGVRDVGLSVRVAEEAEGMPHIVSGMLRATQQLLNPWLNLNVKVSGEVAYVNGADRSDFLGAMEAMGTFMNPAELSLDEIKRHYKFYISHTEVEGQSTTVCSCLPRGVVGLARSLEYSFSGKRLPHNLKAIKAAMHSSTFMPIEEVAKPYSQVRSKDMRDSSKPIYIIQGLPRDILANKYRNPKREFAFGSHSENDNRHAIIIESPNAKMTATHELRHAAQPPHRVPGGFKQIFAEEDAFLAVSRVFPDEFVNQNKAFSDNWGDQSRGGLPVGALFKE